MLGEQARLAQLEQTSLASSDDGVADFVSRYMPAYEAFLPALYEAALGDGVDGKPTFLAKIDSERRPIA